MTIIHKIKDPNLKDLEIWSKNLTKIYGQGKEKVAAVKGISLQIKSGVFKL